MVEQRFWEPLPWDVLVCLCRGRCRMRLSPQIGCNTGWDCVWSVPEMFRQFAGPRVREPSSSCHLQTWLGAAFSFLLQVFVKHKLLGSRKSFAVWNSCLPSEERQTWWSNHVLVHESLRATFALPSFWHCSLLRHKQLSALCLLAEEGIAQGLEGWGGEGSIVLPALNPGVVTKGWCHFHTLLCGWVGWLWSSSGQGHGHRAALNQGGDVSWLSLLEELFSVLVLLHWQGTLSQPLPQGPQKQTCVWSHNSSCFVNGRLLITEETLVLRTHSSSLPFTTTKHPRITPLLIARLRHFQMPSLCTVMHQYIQNYTLIISGLFLFCEQAWMYKQYKHKMSKQ